MRATVLLTACLALVLGGSARADEKRGAARADERKEAARPEEKKGTARADERKEAARPEEKKGTARPHIDASAVREAIDATRLGEQTASSASYAHFLRARMLHFSGRHREAIDALRLAQVTDDRSGYLGVQLAEEYARLGDFKRAEREVKRVIERNPSSYPGQLMMGRVLLESRKYTRAKVHLRKALKLNPRDPEGYLVLAQLQLETDEPDEAVKTVEELGRRNPEESIGFHRLGLAFAERGDLARAEKLLVKSTQREAADFEVLVTLARIYEATGRAESAEKMLALSLELRPESPDVLMAAGRLALRLGAPDRAKDYLDRVLLLSDAPENVVRVAFLYLAARQLDHAAEVLDAARGELPEPRLAFYAGLVHERQRRWAEAAKAFASIPEGSELANEAADRRARCLSLSGQHAAAIALYRAAQGARPDDDELVVSYARALDRSGARKDAEAVLTRSHDRRATPRLVDALADFYARHGRFDDAISLLARALTTTPTEKTLHYSLGSVYERKGDLERSLQQMRRVLELDPDDPSALNFIGYTLAEQGVRYDEAERMIARALELRPDNGAFLDSLGWVYFRRGDYPKAVEVLEKAVELAPGEPVIVEHLGDAYRSLARREEAKDAYRRALDLVRSAPDGEALKGQKKGLERKLKLLSSESVDR